MRQITAYLIGWSNVRLACTATICALILLLCCSMVVADSHSISPAVADKPRMPTHTVVAGDTLWNVAMRLRPDNMSMALAMDSLYDNNPEAFLEGDSTKLIEGSIVSFPPTTVIDETPETVVLEKNPALLIPSIETTDADQVSIEEEATSEVGTEVSEEQQISTALPDFLPTEDPNIESRSFIDPVEHTDKAIITEEKAFTDTVELEQSSSTIQNEDPEVYLEKDLSQMADIELKKSEPELQLDQPPQQHIIANPQANTPLLEKLKALIAEYGQKDLYLLVSRVKQLPMDFWIFVGALIFAMVINRFRKLDKANKEATDSKNTDKPIETVLDGPFPDSSDDEVFADSTDNSSVGSKKKKDPKLQSEEDLTIDLPGSEALEAQLREDDDQLSQASKFLEVDFEDDFEDDTMEIDPLQIRLDMASLCIEMDDIENAQAILEEIIGEADKSGKAKAREILDSIET